MTDADDLSAQQFGATFKGFMEKMASAAPDVEAFFERKLREHFAVHASKLPIVSETFDATEHVNLHRAIEGYVNAADRTFELLGVNAQQDYRGVKLSQLVTPPRGGLMGGGGPTEGPVEYANLRCTETEVIACVKTGLYLVAGADRAAILVSSSSDMPWKATARIEVMTKEKESAERIIAGLRTEMRRSSIYRGRVISLSLTEHRALAVDFHHLPSISRDEIILPEGLLDRIERLTIGFARHAGRLMAAGQHIKRGLLLYGPPGTGKTLTAMYLAGRMPDRTVILLTGDALGLIERTCAMARVLQPATLILEDVDLVAEERTHQNKACNTVLFELMNQMDGLADDADIMFLLTTNRPEILEPALAARPGRIDQALEVPAPDATCRKRLLSLYSRGLDLALAEEQRIIAQTEGVSAAFIRELVRKAALIAADQSSEGKIAVRDQHVDEALRDLVLHGGELTKSLLGATSITIR